MDLKPLTQEELTTLSNQIKEQNPDVTIHKESTKPYFTGEDLKENFGNMRVLEGYLNGKKTKSRCLAFVSNGQGEDDIFDDWERLSREESRPTSYLKPISFGSVLIEDSTTRRFVITPNPLALKVTTSFVDDLWKKEEEPVPITKAYNFVKLMFKIFVDLVEGIRISNARKDYFQTSFFIKSEDGIRVRFCPFRGFEKKGKGRRNPRADLSSKHNYNEMLDNILASKISVDAKKEFKLLRHESKYQLQNDPYESTIVRCFNQLHRHPILCRDITSIKLWVKCNIDSLKTNHMQQWLFQEMTNMITNQHLNAKAKDWYAYIDKLPEPTPPPAYGWTKSWKDILSDYINKNQFYVSNAFYDYYNLIRAIDVHREVEYEVHIQILIDFYPRILLSTMFIGFVNIEGYQLAINKLEKLQKYSIIHAVQDSSQV